MNVWGQMSQANLASLLLLEDDALIALEATAGTLGTSGEPSPPSVELVSVSERD